jgi:hypothetical protein
MIIKNLKKAVAVIAFVTALSFAGPNDKAQVLIDYNALTPEIESCESSQSEKMFVAVRVTNAVNLDGFSFKVVYDTTQFRFLACNPVIDDLNEKMFLKSSGGKIGPELILEKPGSIEIASSLIGNSSERAPDGNGILAILSFQHLNNYACGLYLKNVELTDSDLTMDKKE